MDIIKTLKLQNSKNDFKNNLINLIFKKVKDNTEVKKSKYIIIPDSVSYLNDFAFWLMNIEAIIIPKSVIKIGNCAFSDCKKLIAIRIPNSIKSINSYTFVYCKSLTTINIPNSVIYIGTNAFEYCINLKTVIIPNSVKSVEESAFDSCFNLTLIKIPKSVTTIKLGVFDNCDKLISVNIPKIFEKDINKIFKNNVLQSINITYI